MYFIIDKTNNILQIKFGYCKTQILYVDGTYESSPKLSTSYSQYMVHNDINAPLFFLLPEKSTETYTTAFTHIVKKMQQT